MTILTEVERIAAAQWKEAFEHTTFEIAAKILVSRYQSEYQEIRKAVKNI